MLKEGGDAAYTAKPPTTCPVMARLTSTRTPMPPKMPEARSTVGRPRTPSLGANSFKPPTPPPSPSREQGRSSRKGGEPYFFSGAAGRPWEGGAGGLEGGDGVVVTPRTPRRVQLLNFWARTRMIQRAIMVSER